MSPAGIAVMICMPISGFLLGRRFDARYLIFFGVLCIAAGSYWAALMNLKVSPWVLVVRRGAQLVGMGFIFAPINTAAYLYLPRDQTSNATGLFNMMRNEGASLGVSLVSIVLAQRGQLHQSRLVDSLTPLDQPYVEVRRTLTQQFHRAGFGPVTDSQMALQQIYEAAQRQALASRTWICSGSFPSSPCASRRWCS